MRLLRYLPILPNESECSACCAKLRDFFGLLTFKTQKENGLRFIESGCFNRKSSVKAIIMLRSLTKRGCFKECALCVFAEEVIRHTVFRLIPLACL